MLILRSILLSFVILIPRLLLVPFLIVALMLASVAMGLVVFVFALISPIIAMIVGSFLGMAMMMIPMMIGMRLVFTNRRHDIDHSYKQLVLPAAIYGFIETFLLGILSVGGAALVKFAAPEVPLVELWNGQAAANDTAPETLGGLGDASVILFALAFFIAMSAIRAALLVPLAGAAAGRDGNGQPHTPLAGFGVGLIPLTFLVFLSYAAAPLMGFAVVLVTMLLGQYDALVVAFQNLGQALLINQWKSFSWTDLLILGCGWVLWTWVFCVQCAGGVLYYLRGCENFQVQKASPMPPPTPELDVRALRKSRTSTV
ncbi:MAG: hypothetical protein ABJL99_26300 [Aliishimia sp.]